MSLLGAAWLVLAFVTATWLCLPAIRRSQLGLAHPAAAFLALEALFFGVGSVVLSVVDGATGPAWFVGAAMMAFGLGVGASSAVAARRTRGWPGPSTERPEDRPGIDPEPETGWRRFVPALLAAGAVLTVAPVLVRTGIPFLTSDITGARSELVGLPVQLIRIALPGLAVALLFDWSRTRATGAHHRSVRAILPAAGVAVLLVFTVLLASRYLAAEMAAALGLAWLLAGHRLPLRPTIAVIGIGAVVFIGIGIVRSYDRAQGQELVFGAERTVSRILLVQPRTLEALQEVIPAEQPYFLGLTWARRAAPLFGRFDVPNLGYWIYPRVVEDAAIQATAGYAAPGLLGESWANFGPAGVILFALLGVAVERLGVLVAARRERVVDVAAGALAILFVARTHALGLGGLLILLIILVAWRALVGGLGSLSRDARSMLRYRPLAS